MRRSGPNMRLTHQRMAGRLDNTPESVLDWLEEQLECRGIDHVVYTRYILSLLQDYDTDDELSFDGMPSMSRRSFKRSNGYNGIACVKDNLKPVTTNKFKHKRYLNTAKNTAFDDFCTQSSMNSDEERKLAVVQCLKSASEQELGIESFVDELCAKLKNIKVLSESASEISVDTAVEPNTSAKISPKEQALKYFAAFPALDKNINEDKSVTSKPDVAVVLTKDFNHNSVPKWNGQKIIEFITSANTTNEELDVNTCDRTPNAEPNGNSHLCLEATEAIKADERKTDIKLENGLKLGKNDLIYCSDIENGVLIGDNGSADNACPLVVDNTPDKKPAVTAIGEDNDRFERLVNKFNSNIASIWSGSATCGTEATVSKLDNIWSFDSSFSSNQSSATPSPKPLAIDFWSTLGVSELSQALAAKRAPPMPSITDCWSSSLLQSYSMFPDDGFIDGNHELIDDESNWTDLTIDKIKDESNRTTLENHQKNSPFIEFNSSLNSKSTAYVGEDISLSKLLAAVLQQSEAHPPSPTLSEENLLTSSRTHFQPIRQDLFDKDSDDDSVDITDTEVNKLVICSDKCPNNADVVVEDTASRLHLRPLTTSFGELASYMGPFNDDLFGNDFPILRDSEEIIVANETKMSDKSTNTEIIDNQLISKTKLSSIEESAVESEPEYQDLYDMINEVLRNGISEEDSPLGSSLTRMADEWYESDGGAEHVPEAFLGANRQKRLSWNYYLDTYECPIVSTDHKSRSPVQPLSDDVFGDETLYNNNQLNREDYPEYEETYGDYFQSEESIGFMSDENHGYDMSIYPIESHLVGDEVSFGPQLDLQFKSRQNLAVKRKPCSFFIEGNCKRSDCKYSHDISAITCKYWEEGFCFKAELCPFLHGYADEEKGTRRNGSPFTSRYAIESESDFPALSTNCLSEESADLWVEPEPVLDVEKHLLELAAKSMAEQQSQTRNALTVPFSKAKLPIAVFMKKKVKKRKDRNLQ